MVGDAAFNKNDWIIFFFLEWKLDARFVYVVKTKIQGKTKKISN